MENDIKMHWFDTGNGGELPYYWEVEQTTDAFY